MDGSNQFKIKSASGKQHTLKFKSDNKMPECTCKDLTRWHIPWKNFFAVFNHFPNWEWTSLPKEYLENEYLTADSAILTNPSNGDSNLPATLSSSPAPGDLDREEIVGFTDELPQHEVSIVGSIKRLYIDLFFICLTTHCFHPKRTSASSCYFESSRVPLI